MLMVLVTDKFYSIFRTVHGWTYSDRCPDRDSLSTCRPSVMMRQGLISCFFLNDRPIMPGFGELEMFVVVQHNILFVNIS
jgi:hypothetical protein